MKNGITGFSLIEILVGILIVSIVMIAGFQSLSAIGIGKIKIIEQTRIEKEAYFATEKFFEMVKKGGTIDYEEYWNRNAYNTVYENGHFRDISGYGNYGVGGTPTTATYGAAPYDCASVGPYPLTMGTNGCLGLNSGEPQRYTEYALQFIDRNSDADAFPDETGDDLHIGIGPAAFPGGSTDAGELYLINAAGDERTFFRWTTSIDPDAPTAATCDQVVVGEKGMTGDACVGSIEFLKLKGEDWGIDHLNDTGVWDGDGIIDTWLIHPDFEPDNLTNIIAGIDSTNYWQKIFPSSVHVSEVEFYLYPNKDTKYSWRDTSPGLQVAPYLQIKMTLQPSWKEKRKIKGKTPEVKIATTIQLSNLDFR